MAGAALALGLFSGGMGILGGIQEAQAIKQDGNAQSAALQFEAKQLDQRSKQELAAGQQQAQEARKKKRLALSALQNRAAASGFSATDPTNLQIATDIDERGELQGDLAFFEGQLQHDNLLNHANAKRASASNVRKGAKLKARAAITKSITGGMSRFAAGIGGPSGGGSTGGSLRYG